jgi:hypothetical protein
VPLFIDRLPLHRWVDRTRTPPSERWSVRVPVALTPIATCPLPIAHKADWTIDTGATGEAFAWRHHLEQAGLDPDTDRVASSSIRLFDGTVIAAPVRRASLWIVGNIPELKPFRLPLNRGITLIDSSVSNPDPELHRPLLGMSILIRVGLRMEIDFGNRTVSIWTPDF